MIIVLDTHVAILAVTSMSRHQHRTFNAHSPLAFKKIVLRFGDYSWITDGD